jgi:DNA-binding NarL/FixJ family response regulator
MNNLLIIHRNPLLRQGWSLIIQSFLPDAQVYEATDVAESNDQYFWLKPDLIFLGLDHLNLSKALYTIQLTIMRYPSARIIVYDDDFAAEVVVEYFKIGISGYISKYSSLVETKRCICEVIEGRRYLDMSALINSILVIQPKKMQLKKPYNLTANEQKIARYIVSGLRVSEIAQILNRKISTISTVKSNIFKKVEVNNIIALATALE